MKTMKTNRNSPILLSYLPHGLNHNTFKPLDKTTPELVEFKNKLFKGKEYEFTLFFNSRNMRRKQIPDALLAFRLFLDKLTPEQAQKEFKDYLMSNKMVIPRTQEEVDALEFKDVKMRVGIHKRTFVKNVVAIGLSAGFIEPLESNGLFSVHEFLFKLIDILERKELSQFDRDMYNNSCRDLFDQFSKFVALHYALSHRTDTPYWKAINNKSFTDSYGDPYFPYLGRVDTFWNMAWRYMSAWHHPFETGGIPFIATGLQVNMVNNYRFMNIQKSTTSYDVVADIDYQIKIWEDKKSRWNFYAEQAPTLRQYLKETYYVE